MTTPKTSPKSINGYIVSQQSITIGEIIGTKYTVVRQSTAIGPGEEWYIEIISQRNGKSYDFYLNDRKLQTAFDQILSTFQFLNNTNDGTLEATVIRSPTCPGPVTDQKSCEAPVANETFNITKLSDNKNIQSVHSDQDGKFTVSLTSGSYKLQNSTGGINKFGGIGKNIRNSTFTITAGKTTIQRFDVDTGIR